MGEVRTTARLRNIVDVGLVKRNLIQDTQIPVSNLDFLVDTGAVMVMLPEDEVDKLDLLRGDKVIVTYADERKEEVRTALGLEITVGKRTMVTDCLIGPPLCEPLLGQLVLEELDLVVDCNHRTLMPRPDSPNRPLLKMK